MTLKNRPSGENCRLCDFRTSFMKREALRMSAQAEPDPVRFLIERRER